MKPLCFSYSRYSTAEQRKGASAARQAELRDAFVAKIGGQLDTSMLDSGVSARAGKQRSDKTALGNFLSLVKHGKIPVGSYLIVESLDRLSREEVTEGLELLLGLIRAGIKVVQLQPVEVIFEKPVDPMKLMMGIMELSRGWSESEMKSKRIGDAWERRRQKARAEKQVTTKRCLHWLRAVNGKYELIPERAEAVRAIFRHAVGGLGGVEIIRRLERDGHQPFTGKWTGVYVARILRHRGVLGEYQPMKGKKPFGEPITGYYPPVVTEADFYRAQQAVAQRKTYKGGNRITTVNLFQGLMYNALNPKDAFEFKTVTTFKRGKRYVTQMYVNAESLAGRTSRICFPVQPIETVLLATITKINPQDVMPQQATTAEDTTSLTAELEDVERKLVEIEDQMVEGGHVSALARAAARLEAKRDELVKRLAETQHDQPAAKTFTEFRRLYHVLNTDNSNETRLRIRVALRRVIERIDCVFMRQGRRQIAHLVVRWKGTDKCHSYQIKYRGELVNIKRRTPEYLSASHHIGEEKLNIAKMNSVLANWTEPEIVVGK